MSAVLEEDADISDDPWMGDSDEPPIDAESSDAAIDVGDQPDGDVLTDADQLDACVPTEELCNGLDDDCDEEVDEEAVNATTWYEDSDGDSYGDDDSTVVACDEPDGYTDRGGDCDDADSSRHPNASEQCNGLDDDCDDEIDNDAIDRSLWYRDGDGDGYGDGDDTARACDQPDGYVDIGGDCHPDDADKNPGANERCNGADDDCNGEFDDGVCAECTRYVWGANVYLFCDTADTWMSAQLFCMARGYDLVIINDAEEDAWLWEQASSIINTDWWIGLTDAVLEGTYTWVNLVPAQVDQTCLGYCNWRDDPLVHIAAEDCIELDVGSGLWADGGCEQIQPFICELFSL